MESNDRVSTRDHVDSQAYEAGHHWVSPFNYSAPVQEGYAFPKPLTIFDSTLRKMMFTSGTRPSIDDLLHVAQALEEAGVRQIVLNVHWWGDPTLDARESELCRAILARDFAFRTTIYSDAAKPSPGSDARRYPVSAREAVDLLRAMGTKTMAIAVGPTKDAATRDREMERVEELFSYAHSLGMVCGFGVSDMARMDFEQAVHVANQGIEMGAVHLELSDSYSSLSPEAMKHFVAQFRARLAKETPISMHVHNDFGLGSATAIAAATAGANPDVAVNGLAYRSGFAALEEVVVSLELLYGVRTGIQLDRLQRLSDIVAERSGLPNHPLKPITGAHAFVRDLPMWVLPYLENGPDGFPPVGSCLPPSVVGSRMRTVWGNHLSNSVVRAKLNQMGVGATDQKIAEIRRRIESRVQALTAYPHWLSEDEVEAICREVDAQGTHRNTET